MLKLAFALIIRLYMYSMFTLRTCTTPHTLPGYSVAVVISHLLLSERYDRCMAALSGLTVNVDIAAPMLVVRRHVNHKFPRPCMSIFWLEIIQPLIRADIIYNILSYQRRKDKRREAKTRHLASGGHSMWHASNSSVV